TNAVQATTLYTYTATAQKAVRDARGNVTRYGYDAAGRLVSTTDPLTGTVQYQYDAAGNTTVVTQTDQVGTVHQVETRAYDALNAVISDTLSGPLTPPQTTALGYDQDGNVTETRDPIGALTTNTYDWADQLVEVDYGLTYVPVEQDSYDA